MRKPTKKDTMDQLKEQLDALNLSTQGKKETLFKRLWNAVTSLASSASAPGPEPSVAEQKVEGRNKSDEVSGHQPYRSFLCFDVEATCSGGAKEFDFPNEIIEFPVVLLQWSDEETSSRKQRLRHVDTFHTYIRPTWRPTLTPFCTELTGITQSTVDASPTFPEAITKLEEWLNKHALLDGGYLSDALWVTDGPWDLRDFVSSSHPFAGVACIFGDEGLHEQIPKQLHITPLGRETPYLFGPYLNIKQAVQTVFHEEWRREENAKKHPTSQAGGRSIPRIGTGRSVSKVDREQGTGPMRYGNIKQMLSWLDIGEFEGRLHSGIDDATNISRILIALADRNVLIEPNARLPPASNMKKWDWMGKPGEVLWSDTPRPVLEDKPVEGPVEAGAPADTPAMGDAQAGPELSVESGGPTGEKVAEKS